MGSHLTMASALMSLFAGAACGAHRATDSQRPDFDSKVVNLDDLIRAAEKGKTRSMWRGVFYCGSDASWHYFVDTPGFAEDWLALPRGDVGVTQEFTAGRDSSRWVNVTHSLWEGKRPLDTTK